MGRTATADFAGPRGRQSRPDTHMPLPTDVSLLAGSDDDEGDDENVACFNETPQPTRVSSNFAHARETELDAVIASITGRKPTDQSLLEHEERSARGARTKFELQLHVHSLKRNESVELPTDFDADVRSAASAARMKKETDAVALLQKRSDDASAKTQNNALSQAQAYALGKGVTQMRHELRVSGTISPPCRGDETVENGDGDCDEYSDADDEFSTTSGLNSSLERFRVDVGEIVAASWRDGRDGGAVLKLGESNEEFHDPFAIDTKRLAAIDAEIGALSLSMGHDAEEKEAREADESRFTAEDDFLSCFGKLDDVDARLRRLKTEL